MRRGCSARMFPEWAGIECLVVRDFYHRYTVDEHTLVAIQSLEDLSASEDPLRQRFAGFLEEVESRALLVVALLFHDTGKAARTGMHVAIPRGWRTPPCSGWARPPRPARWSAF